MLCIVRCAASTLHLCFLIQLCSQMSCSPREFALNSCLSVPW